MVKRTTSIAEYQNTQGEIKSTESSKKEFDDWSYVKCDDEDTREKLEALLIKHILPKYNIDQKTYYKSPERYAETESREKSLRWNPNVAVNALEERT